MNKKLLSIFLSVPILAQCLPIVANEFEPLEEVETVGSSIEMYRLYNRGSGEHFYTADTNEKDTLVNQGWKYEGIGWYAPSSSSTPVYRLFNQNSKDHHYTTDQNERETLIRAGWKEEGIGWYSQKEGEPVPVEIDYSEAYRPILNEAKKIVNNKGQGNYYNSEFEGIADAAYFTESRVAIGYTIQDFSGDGIPELAISLSNEGGEILAVYTLVNNSPINVFHGRLGGTRYYYGENSTFILDSGTGVGYPTFGLFSLSKPEKFIEKSKKPESPLLFEILAFSFSTKWVPPSLVLAVHYFRTKH